MTSLTRRQSLGLLAGVTIPPTAAVGIAAASAAKAASIDDYLASASASEKAWYHANAFAEIMGEMHPEHTFITRIDHDGYFALIAGKPRKGWGKVAKVHIDDGSPLFADDVTGTTAFSDWETGR